MRRTLFVVAALAFIASCAPYQLVEPPKRVQISDTYTVSPQVKWSRVNNTFFKNVEQWTVDGAGLQALMFINNVEDGQPIFRSRRATKIPVFRSSMNTLEIKELFENSMAAMRAQKVKVRKFKPTKFGNADGFRFTFTYKTKGGLDKQGVARGSIRNKKLYLIVYMGTRLHYYGKYRRAAEGVMRSVRFL
ncbi:MAG: hypothetical protein OEU46_20860 [Alphaproteobacteria bacterium]|nr:hypothetical protein [Alphaproteobacteria bacterium]